MLKHQRLQLQCLFCKYNSILVLTSLPLHCKESDTTQIIDTFMQMPHLTAPDSLSGHYLGTIIMLLLIVKKHGRLMGHLCLGVYSLCFILKMEAGQSYSMRICQQRTQWSYRTSQIPF